MMHRHPCLPSPRYSCRPSDRRRSARAGRGSDVVSIVPTSPPFPVPAASPALPAPPNFRCGVGSCGLSAIRATALAALRIRNGSSTSTSGDTGVHGRNRRASAVPIRGNFLHTAPEPPLARSVALETPTRILPSLQKNIPNNHLTQCERNTICQWQIVRFILKLYLRAAPVPYEPRSCACLHRPPPQHSCITSVTVPDDENVPEAS